MLALRRAATAAASKRTVLSVQTASFSADTFQQKERAAEASFFKYVVTMQTISIGSMGWACGARCAHTHALARVSRCN